MILKPIITISLMKSPPRASHRTPAGRAYFELQLFMPPGADSTEELMVKITSRGDNSELERAEGEILGYILAKDLVRLGFALEAYTKEE